MVPTLFAKVLDWLASAQCFVTRNKILSNAVVRRASSTCVKIWQIRGNGSPSSSWCKWRMGQTLQMCVPFNPNDRLRDRRKFFPMEWSSLHKNCNLCNRFVFFAWSSPHTNFLICAKCEPHKLEGHTYRNLVTLDRCDMTRKSFNWFTLHCECSLMEA